MTFHVNIELENQAYAALVHALGSRALAGKPCTAGELVSEWLTADNNYLEARIQRGIVDKDKLLASLRASLSETESSFRRGADSRSWAQAEDEGADEPADISRSVKTPDNTEAEFTEPPAFITMPMWRKGGEPITPNPSVWLTEDFWPERPEVGGAGVPFEPVTPPTEPLPTPERLEETDAQIAAEEADQERNPQPKRARRTKNEMALARNAVTNAYRAAVGNSSWYQGWETANVAGLAAADAAGANAGLTPYQTRQTLMPIVTEIREQFDEPQTGEPDTADHGPDDAAVQRVEDIVTNEQPPKHAEPEPAEALTAHYNEAPIQSTTPDPAPPAEVAAIHGLPTPYPGSVWVPSPASSDDDVFAQFLNG